MKTFVSIIVSILVASATMLYAQEKASYFIVNLNDGSQVAFLMKNKPEVTFSKDAMTVKATEYQSDVTIALKDVLKWTFEKREVTALEQIHANELYFSWSDENIIVKGGDVNKLQNIRLYNLNGSAIQTKISVADNTAQIRVADLPIGTYILIVNGVTYKFRK